MLEAVSPVGGATLRRALIGGAAGGFVLKIVATGATFLLSVLLARVLGAAEFGVYSYVTAWASLLAVPAMLGMDLLLVRSIAGGVIREQWADIRGLLRFTRRSVLVVSIATATAVGLVALAFDPAFGDQTRAFVLAMLLVPLTALIRLNQGAMRGFHRAVRGQIAELLVRPVVTLLLVVLAVTVLGPRFDAVWATGLHVGAGAVALVLGLVLLRRAIPPRVQAAPPATRRRQWLAIAFPLLLVGSMQIANRQVDIVMVGTIAGVEAAGIYTAGARGAELIGFVLVAVNAVFAPAVAALHAAGQTARLQRAATGAARLTFFVSLPLGLAFLVFGDLFLSLFGPEFPRGYPALAVLTVAQLLNAAAGSVAAILTMTGNERMTAAAVGAAALLNVALNAALIPPFGILGAAIASGTSLIAWNAILLVVLYRRLRIDSTALGWLASRSA